MNKFVDALKKVGLNILAAAVPGGPLVAEIVASALGVENEEEKIITALQASPESIVKLKEVELRHQEELIRLAIQGETTRLADVQSARLRDMDIRKSGGGRNVRADVLAYSLMIIITLITAGLFLRPIPEASEATLYMITGGLVAKLGDIFMFEFGSSRSSKDKTEILANGHGKK